MIFLVSIKSQGLSTASPSDGFVDPTTVSEYHSALTYTGSKAATGIEAGRSFFINNVAITTTGTTLVTLINNINLKSAYHHCVASESSGKLVISSIPTFYDAVPAIVDISEGVAEDFGFANPAISPLSDLPTTKDQSIAKTRANMRWIQILESLQLTGNVSVNFAEKAVSATAITPPSNLNFLLTVSENYYSYDFSGNLVYGSDAVRYSIAKALMYSSRKYCKFYDPTFIDSGSKLHNGDVLELIEIGALTNDSDVAYGAVTAVTNIV